VREFDRKGWVSDDDLDLRGYDICLSTPLALTWLERGREECEPAYDRSSSLGPPGSAEGPYYAPSPPDEVCVEELDSIGPGSDNVWVN
jgi:hypothetical protein